MAYTLSVLAQVHITHRPHRLQVPAKMVCTYITGMRASISSAALEAILQVDTCLRGERTVSLSLVCTAWAAQEVPWAHRTTLLTTEQRQVYHNCPQSSFELHKYDT